MRATVVPHPDDAKFILPNPIMVAGGSSNLPFAQTFASSAIAACTAEVRQPEFLRPQKLGHVVARGPGSTDRTPGSAPWVFIRRIAADESIGCELPTRGEALTA